MSVSLELGSLELTGRSRDHVREFVLPDNRYFFAHPAAAEAWLAMREAALDAGLDFGISSAFRSFEDQLRIWHAKWRGERVLLDAACLPIDASGFSPEARVAAILEWSALPGASRHHWGCDFDVFDRAAVPADYRLQLVPEEYAPGGPFARLTAWLDAHMAEFGFFRPYDFDRGGVHPEPWHLSWAPVAVPALAALTPAVLREAIASAEMEGKPAVLEALDRIHAVQVCRVGAADKSAKAIR